MKKYIFSIFVVVLLSLLFVRILYNLNNEKKVNNGFELPKMIEEEVLKNIDKTVDTSPAFLLTNLIDSGDWVTKMMPLDNFKEENKKADEFDGWAVKYSNGIEVFKEKQRYINGYSFSKYSFGDDFFLIINEGEWGGAIYFYPKGDKDKKYKIAEGDFCNFFEVNNSIYFFERKGYTKTRQGRIFQLVKGISNWKVKEISDIGDYPYAYTIVNKNTMYLATYSKLLKIENQKVIDIIVDNAFWKGLSPNSVAYNNGYVYIGTRIGIARINLSNKDVQLLTPKS